MSVDLHYEAQARAAGHAFVCGVDEAGRGPLAGPVVTAAVILTDAPLPEGLNDSKQLRPGARERMFETICRDHIVAVASASAARIDAMNVLAANMQRAEQEKDEALAERFEMVYDEIMALIQAGLPPEVQLINALLRAPYPDGTRELLNEYRAEITPELLTLIEQMAADMAQRTEESEEFAKTAKRLRDIRTQAMLLV